VRREGVCLFRRLTQFNCHSLSFIHSQPLTVTVLTVLTVYYYYMVIVTLA